MTCITNIFQGSYLDLTSTFSQNRSSLSQMFFKIGVLRNFANFTVKQPALVSLFNKVAGRTKKAPTQVFPCEIWELFKDKRNHLKSNFSQNLVFYVFRKFSLSSFVWNIQEFCFHKNSALIELPLLKRALNFWLLPSIS